jgi:hypothetical protein
MPEILTESFCERCGTRYTFESAQPKGARLKGLKTVSRGLRNFVLSDDTSMDEAMAAARNETDREATSQQLDAFHKTFNFCMSCRQYTCSNCWNEIEGRCLSCAPSLGTEVLPSPFPNLDPANGPPFGATTPTFESTNGHEHPEPAAAEPMAWPTSDLMRAEEAASITFDDVIARHEAEAEAQIEPELAEEETFDPRARLAALDAAFEPPPAVEVESIEAEPVELEPVQAAVEPEPVVEVAPEPILEAEPEPEPVLEVEPEPIAAASIERAEPAAADSEAHEDDERAAAAAARTTDLLDRFRPGQSLEDAIAAYERAQATDDAIAAYERAQAAADALAEPMAAEQPSDEEPEPQPEPIAAAREAPPPEPVAPEPVAPQPVAPQPVAPEPVAATPPPEPAWPAPEEQGPAPFRLPRVTEPTAPPADRDRVAATAQPREPWTPEIEPSPEPVAAEARDDVVPQPTWQMMAPDSTGEPEWPAPPAWPGAGPSEGLPFLGRPAQPTGGMDAVWAESAREVATAQSAAPTPGARAVGGVQPCISCGLSLSANARFCRRCGTRQE